MNLTVHADTKSFREAALDRLMADEAENNLMISLALRDSGPETSGWFMATVGEGPDCVVAALMTPPGRIILYASDSQARGEAVTWFCGKLKDRGVIPGGVLAETILARSFAAAFTGGGAPDAHMRQRVLSACEVRSFGSAPGRMREMDFSDMHFMPEWAARFAGECRLDARERTVEFQTQSMMRHFSNGTMFLWEADGAPAAMASSSRRTANGAGIAHVYTPPELRGRGYATSLVASLTAARLASGVSFCFLFADACNPVSNGIYEKIGYEHVCDFEQIDFAV